MIKYLKTLFNKGIKNMNIILIGMPGSGKSTAGVLAAKALCMEFTDTDLIIQKKADITLQEIINVHGIEYFEKFEENTILNLKCSNCIIATGGSVVYYPKAMEYLKSIGKILYLHLDFQEVEKRIKNINTRGIVFKSGQTLLDMYNERIKLYNKYYDRIIDCNGKTVEETVKDIVDNCSFI